MERPSKKELFSKLRDAKAAVQNEDVFLIDQDVIAEDAMELGYDGVLLNSAVALSNDPVNMAVAFSNAVSAGRQAHLAGLMPKRNLASPSTPLIDTPFWKQVEHNEI